MEAALYLMFCQNCHHTFQVEKSLGGKEDGFTNVNTFSKHNSFVVQNA
jgi:hypothetical protein